MAIDKKTDEAMIENLLLRIPYLVDADNAGGEFSDKCTLILTDDDLAKGLEVKINKNNYGVLPVGKTNYGGVSPMGDRLLNVREASDYQIMKDTDIQHIIQILGLEHGKVYDNHDNVKSLRYGHLMIITNQDKDGFQLKGLLINLFHCLWPSLLKMIPSFLGEFIIPIVVATGKDGHVLYFYNMPQYKSWKKSLGGEEADDWTINYYEGLGSYNREVAKKYFQRLETHKKYFTWVDERDGDAIDMAFSNMKIEARKTWLQQYERGTYLDRTEKLIKYSDFVNKELILFFLEDLQQSIPSMVDGLKLRERKILFCAFKHNLETDEISVSRFSSYVSVHFNDHSGVHARTIVGMAQDFVGRNNINLFNIRGGQVGTRYEGDEYDVCANCTFTNLTPIAQFMFLKDDDILLDYPKVDDILMDHPEQPIEPTWYAPVIPLVLVNGSEGVGVGGCSTFVPSYNPRDLCASVRSLLRGEPMVPIHPWYKGFQGTIEKTTTKESGTSYTISGKINQIDETKLEITELPIRTWTQDYKKFLERAKTRIVTGTDKIMDLLIKEYYEKHHPTTVYFEIIMSKENLQMAREEGLEKVFRLTTTIHTNNMLLFDKNGVIKKYDNPEQILKEFFELRLELYNKRRNMLLNDFRSELSTLSITRRYIFSVLNGDINIDVLMEDYGDAIVELQKFGFGDFCDYLLSINLLLFTRKNIMKLDSQIAILNLQLQELEESTPTTLWIEDLDALELKLDELESKVMNEAGPSSKSPREINTKKPPNFLFEDAPQHSSSMEMVLKIVGILPSRKIAPNKRAAAQKQPATTLTEIPDDDDAIETLLGSGE